MCSISFKDMVISYLLIIYFQFGPSYPQEWTELKENPANFYTKIIDQIFLTCLFWTEVKADKPEVSWPEAEAREIIVKSLRETGYFLVAEALQSKGYPENKVISLRKSLFLVNIL